MTEDQLEQETLAWLAELGYEVHSGPDIAHDGGNPQRASYRQVVLPFRLREAIQRLNPNVPTAAREDALQQVMDLGVLALLPANRAFHKLLVGGVPVEYQKDGQTVGDFVRLVDWSNVSRNEFWAANQFTIKGLHHIFVVEVVALALEEFAQVFEELCVGDVVARLEALEFVGGEARFLGGLCLAHPEEVTSGARLVWGQRQFGKVDHLNSIVS